MAILNNTQINGQLNVDGGVQFAEKVTFNSTINKTFSDGVYSPITTSADGNIIPEKWTFDHHIDPSFEDEVTIKIPDGNRSTAGIFLSLDNGEHYYPILLSTEEKLTNQFSAGSYLTLIFNGTSYYSYNRYPFYPIDGGTVLSTNARGNWKVINYCEESKSTLKLSTARTLWGQSFDGSKDIDGNILDAGNITSLKDSTYTIGSSINHWKTGFFDELLISSDTNFTSTSASIGYIGTSIIEGAIELSKDQPYIDFHYNKATQDYSVRLISDGVNRLHILPGAGDSPASLTYNDRIIHPLTFHSGIFYCNNNIETSNSFVSNRNQTGDGFALYHGNVQCGTMYIARLGTSNIVGSSILSIGNSTPSGQEFNSKGVLRLYGESGYRTDIVSQSLPNDDREAQLIHLPKYNDGDLTLSHTRGDAAVGSPTNPVYVEQYGRITASNATIGSSNQPIFMSNGTLTASSATVGNGVKFIYLENGVFKSSTETVGNNKKLMFLKDGVMTASNASVGSEIQPIFMENGVITESDCTVGSDNQLIYLENGNFSASNANIGSLTTPIYMENGVLKTCKFNHYIDDNSVAINRTSKPNENFYVNGTSYFKGRASFEDLVIPTSEPDDPQPGNIWIS